jgi:hypothetical protein
MAVVSIPSPATWPSTLPNPQILTQILNKNPRVLETGAGGPIYRKKINDLAPTHTEFSFVVTMCKLKTFMNFYQADLVNGLRPISITANTENGIASETAWINLTRVEKQSDLKAVVYCTAEIKQRSYL